MAALTAFLPYLIPHVPGCSEPYAVQALRSTCIEFCAKTLLFQEISVYPTQAGVGELELDIPSNAVLTKILTVSWKNRLLQPLTTETVREAVLLRGAVSDVLVQQSEPRGYFQRVPNAPEISLYPLPSESESDVLTIKAAFVPSRVSATVPDFLFEDWVDEIAAGAAMRLMLTPSQPFANPALAGVHKQMYETGVREGLIEARHGQLVAASRVQHVRFP